MQPYFRNWHTVKWTTFYYPRPARRRARAARIEESATYPGIERVTIPSTKEHFYRVIGAKPSHRYLLIEGAQKAQKLLKIEPRFPHYYHMPASMR